MTCLEELTYTLCYLMHIIVTSVVFTIKKKTVCTNGASNREGKLSLEREQKHPRGRDICIETRTRKSEESEEWGL